MNISKIYNLFLNYWGIFWIFALWVIFDAWHFKDYWEKWWMLLMLIVLISPITTIFPKIKLFTSIKWLRKPLGIIAWCFMIAHSIGYFIHYSGFTTPLWMLTDSHFLKYDNGLMWWFFGSVIAFFLLITSNAWSVKIMKEKWKYLHVLTHMLFIFTILHIIFITMFREKWPIVIFIIYLILQIMVFFKIRF